MIYLLFGAGFTLWVICAFLVTGLMLERDGFWSKVPFFAMIFLTVSGAAYMSGRESDRPCVQYEQRMMYNAATKTMMPARVCVERGEWAE